MNRFVNSDESTLQRLRSIITHEQHGFNFLFTNGYGSVKIRFSCDKTEFNDQGKLFMTIVSTERDGSTELQVNIPVKQETTFRSKEEELDSKFFYQPTGRVGSYSFNQPSVNIVSLNDLLKSFILFFKLENVLVVQYDTHREYHFFGPTLNALVQRVRAIREKMNEQELETSMAMRSFLEQIRIALDKKFEVDLGGKREDVVIYVNDEKFPLSTFAVPVKDALFEGGKTYDIFRVQKVEINPITNGVMLDLGIFLDHSHNPNIQYVFTTLQQFEMLYGLTQYRTVIHHSTRPNLSKTVQIGPLYYHGKNEPLDTLLTELVGVACVYLSVEPAPKTSFAIEMKPVGELFSALDKAKSDADKLKEPKAPTAIALRLLDDVRSGANLQVVHKFRTQQDIINDRLREYQTPTSQMPFAAPAFSR